MNENPLISIIVPVYKVEDYLSRCVDSLLDQTYDNLEIILVDDGSPDSCGAICDAYAARDRRVRVIHKKNGGLSSARNAGIDVARGDYLGFVDSDDWVDVHTYEWLLTMALEENVKLVCAGRYDYNSGTGEKTIGLCPPKREVISGGELAKRIFLWDNVDSAAWDKLYHRSLFRELRYPLGVVSEDLPVTYRAGLEAGRVGMLDRPVYYYFHREGSITTAAVSERSFQPSSNTRQVLEYVRRENPELLDYATAFHISHLGYICTVTELAGKEAMQRFRTQYDQKRRELRSFLPFILRSPLIKKKDRLTWITISFGCYGFLRKLYHMGR
ncbi:MAG: glycosyltransferase [Oscillospiraceae bacterium]|nr:glycosyltransferase [Oscillospiraceae bacterium]